MSWKNQSSRTNTGNHTYVNTKYAFSDKVKLSFETDSKELKEVVSKFDKEIAVNTILLPIHVSAT